MEPVDIKTLKKFKKKVAEAECKGDVEDEAFCSSIIADIYSKYGEHSDALELYRRALSLYEGLNKQIDIAVACRLLGECYCKIGELDKALSLHKKYLNLASACNDAVEEQRALTTIGNTHRSRHEVASTNESKVVELEKAKSAFTKSLDLCETLNNTGSISEKDHLDMKGRLLYNLGLVYGDLNDMDASFRYLNNALSIFQRIFSLEILYLCQRALSDLHVSKGNWTEAKRLLEDACKTARKSKDKISEADAMLSQAMVHVQVNEFPQARHILKKVHTMKTSQSDEAQQIRKMYKSVRSYENLISNLKRMAADDHKARIPVYEKLADTAVDLGITKLALIFYNKQLSVSVAAQACNKEVIGVHVSLAQTYEDSKQYDKAIQHYMKEIECRGEDHEQICRSWLNIALNQENSGVKYKDIQTSYVKAVNAAKRAKHRKLQIRALTALAGLTKIHKDEKSLKQIEEKLASQRAKYNITDSELQDQASDAEEGDGLEVDSDDDDNASVMSELTESEAEEEKESTVRAVRRAGKKTLIFERNKLGETPLHRACIKGNLKEVKQLLAKGHPRNPQDNNGWTPLHEATNNGHLDVTEYLVQNGADINNRGGTGCKGTTPLIDAATNGHIEIMHILISNGANVIAKDDHGQTALHYFEKLYEDSRDDIDRETEYKCRNMLQILKERMPERRGSVSGSRPSVLSQLTSSAHIRADKHPMPDKHKNKQLPNITQIASKNTHQKSPDRSQGASYKTKKKSTSPRATTSTSRPRNNAMLYSDSDSDSICSGLSEVQATSTAKGKSPKPLPSDTDDSENIFPAMSDNDNDHHSDMDACESYRSAISSVGRSACRTTQPAQSKTKHKSSLENRALLNEDDILLEDSDWLVNDLGPRVVRRKPVDCHGYLSGGGGVRKRSRSGSPSPTHKATNKRNSNSKSQLDRSECDKSPDRSPLHQKKRIRIESSDSENEISEFVGSQDTQGGRLQASQSSGGNSVHIVEGISDEDSTPTTMQCFNNEIELMFDDMDDNLCVVLSQDGGPSSSVNAGHSTGSTSSNSKNKYNVGRTSSSQNKATKQSKMTDFRRLDSGNTTNRQTSATQFRTTQSSSITTQLTSSFQMSNLQNAIPNCIVPSEISTSNMNHPAFTPVNNVSSAPVQRTNPNLVGNVIRLKVKVDDFRMFVPVIDPEHTKTFGWLAEDVSWRYYKEKEIKLKLRIGRDGVYFNHDDIVSYMLQDNDEIEAYLVDHEQPPMGDLYRDKCKKLKTVMYKNIENILKMGQGKGALNLADLALHGASLTPVLKVLQHQTCIQDLQLRGNRLGNVGLESLCKVLGTMPNVNHLRLASNNISAEGFKHLVSAVSTGDPALQNLTSLDLSHNQLFDGCLPQVAAMINCLPKLGKLSLSSCHITAKFFHNDRSQLPQALHKSSLQCLDISYNQLGCMGLELLLKCQNPTRVTHLNLSGTLSDARSSQAFRHLYDYASQDGCALQELKLCNCNLTMEDADSFTRIPAVAQHLQKMDISGNPKFDNQMLLELVQASTCDTSPLKEIYANHAGITAPLSVQLLDAISDKLAAKTALRRLEFSCKGLEKVDVESLSQIWRDKFEEYANVNITNEHVTLAVNTS